MKRSHGILFIMAAMLLPAASYADSIVNLSFGLPAQSASQGGLLTFSGTLAVTGDPDPIYINGDSIAASISFGFAGLNTPDPSLLMLDDLFFLLNAPFPTMSSDGANGPSSATFDFFTIAIGSLVTPGTYLGTFNVLGGPDAFAQDILASATFQIDVTAASTTNPVPEPNTVILLSTGLLGFGVWRRLTVDRFRPSR
jgi:hypothetical protein